MREHQNTPWFWRPRDRTTGLPPGQGFALAKLNLDQSGQTGRDPDFRAAYKAQGSDAWPDGKSHRLVCPRLARKTRRTDARVGCWWCLLCALAQKAGQSPWRLSAAAPMTASSALRIPFRCLCPLIGCMPYCAAFGFDPRRSRSKECNPRRLPAGHPVLSRTGFPRNRNVFAGTRRVPWPRRWILLDRGRSLVSVGATRHAPRWVRQAGTGMASCVVGQPRRMLLDAISPMRQGILPRHTLTPNAKALRTMTGPHA